MCNKEREDNNFEIFMSIMAGLKCEDENTLSDTIWAMCMADKTFLQLFFDFMFGKEKENAYCIIREVDANCYGRNDFVILTESGDKYYVESKINDKNLNLRKYLSNDNIDEKHLAYLIKDETDYDKYNDIRINGNMFEYHTENHVTKKVQYRKWSDFAKESGYKYIEYYIKRITGCYDIEPISANPCGKKYIRLYNNFISNKDCKLQGKKDDTWSTYKAYGSRYFEIKNHKLWFYIKYTPEYNFMFLFGIDNKFQNIINSQKISFTFLECIPLGYYFHDYYSVYYVPIKEEELDKEKEVEEKLSRALDEMKKYLGM